MVLVVHKTAAVHFVPQSYATSDIAEHIYNVCKEGVQKFPQKSRKYLKIIVSQRGVIKQTAVSFCKLGCNSANRGVIQQIGVSFSKLGCH